MRSRQEIKDALAREHGYNNWPELLVLEKGNLSQYIDIAISNYAFEALREDRHQLKVALADRFGAVGSLTHRCLNEHPFPILKEN